MTYVYYFAAGFLVGFMIWLAASSFAREADAPATPEPSPAVTIPRARADWWRGPTWTPRPVLTMAARWAWIDIRARGSARYAAEARPTPEPPPIVAVEAPQPPPQPRETASTPEPVVTATPAPPPPPAAPQTAPAYAGTLSREQIAGAARAAGWPEAQIGTVVAVAWCESTGNPGAVGGAGEVGLLQIHPVHTALHARFNLREPVQNMAAGLEVWRSSGWAAWSCAR